MRIFLDTEFLEDGKTIDLISIGMVRGDGETLYLGNKEADWSRIVQNRWLMEHVIPSLPPITKSDFWLNRHALAKKVEAFCKGNTTQTKWDEPEFWADYASYDWVALCQLFGRMMDLPKRWPMFCNDFQQLCAQHGHTPKQQTEGLHDALADAQWLKREYEAPPLARRD